MAFFATDKVSSASSIDKSSPVSNWGFARVEVAVDVWNCSLDFQQPYQLELQNILYIFHQNFSLICSQKCYFCFLELCL